MSLELAPEVSIREVSPRDGLQAEPKTLDTEVKRDLIDGLALAGVPRIECASFVHPKLLPQMADAEAVMRGLTRRSRTHYSVLVPNVHGAERASALDPDEMTVFVSASETHNWKNVHRSIADSLAEFQKVAEIGRRRSVPVGAYVVTAFGCPYEGKVPESALLDLTYRLFELGIRTITLGDTIGVANPVLVQQRIRTIRQSLPGLTLGLHLHDNRGTALANLLAAVDAGATYFDTALGGIGGSPFSPGAGGNLATEDAVYLLEEMGVDTGIDLNALLVLGDRLAEALEHPLPSRVRAARGRMVPVGKDGTLRDELNG